MEEQLSTAGAKALLKEMKQQGYVSLLTEYISLLTNDELATILIEIAPDDPAQSEFFHLMMECARRLAPELFPE